MPIAFEPDSRVDLPRQAEHRIAGLPGHLRADVGLALDVLGSAACSLIVIGRFTRFAELSTDDRFRVLDRMRMHWIPVMRTVYQGIRRIVIASYYEHPATHAGIGYLGPYYRRGPVFPWEGPLPGRSVDSEPIARGVDPVPAPPPLQFTDASRSLADDRLSADAIVIGTGAGGAVAAARLAEGGLDVIVLERGDLVPHEEMTEEEAAVTARMYADAGARATDDLAVSMLQGETVGGGTTINWMLMLRTPDWVLDEWTSDHGAEGIGPAEMRAVFDRVEQDVHSRPVPDDAHSRNNALLLKGARALGWSASVAANNARECLRTGFCGGGCRYGAKQSAVAVYLPRAARAGARIFANAHAERIHRRVEGGPFPRRQVLATIGRGTARRAVTIDAPLIVVAGGAVRSPLLLQSSGLGNGAVGRYLRFHPTTAVLGIHDTDVYPSAGVPQSIVVDEFMRDGPRGYGFWLECPPVHPVLSSIAVPGFGAEHRRIVESARRQAVFIALTRDGGGSPASQGSVRLGRRGRPRIAYRVGPAERTLLARSTEAAARLHLAAGAREAVTLHTRPHIARDERSVREIRELSYAPNAIGLFTAHVNGTCRLGADRARAACDPSGELYGAPGVFVLDGSLLPTAPGVNPQETIMALSTVLSERLLERYRAARMGT